MSSHQRTDPATTDATAQSSTESDASETLTAQVAVLREENERLRTQFAQTRQTEYRRAALGLGVLGGLAGLGGLVFPATRAPLVALAGIGLFTAVLTYYLTPERFVAASVGERTYTARALLGEALVADFGLQETCIYVPTEGATTTAEAASVTLFVPQHANYTVPDADALTPVAVVPPDERGRGVALPPTGAPLVREYAQTMVETIADTPDALAEQLTDAIVDGFELADTAVIDQNPTDGQLTVGISGSTFGAVDRFDHPIVSLLATGLAVGVETPVSVETEVTAAERFDYLVTCSWDTDTDTDADGDSDDDSTATPASTDG